MNAKTIQSMSGRRGCSVGCAIFDIDGTLTRTNELIFASFNHVAMKYSGRTYTPAEIVAMFGPPEEGAVSAMVGEQRLGKAMDDLCAFYQEHHGSMAALHEGIEGALQLLRERNVPMAVFTGKGRRTTTITLGALGINGYFDLIVSGSDVLRYKPHPEGIRRVIEHFGVPAEQVLMVGDAIADITASRSAGVKSVAALWDSYDRERVAAAGGDFVFHDVPSFVNWLREEVRFIPRFS
jgi:HAD superfamily hydrolase (TIGR01549 family)